MYIHTWVDWTEEAVNVNLVPCKVEWKTSKAFMKRGFIDAARAVYPSVVEHPLQVILKYLILLSKLS